MPTPKQYATLYLRISVARDESDSLERQEYDLRRMAEAEGFEVVAVHRDEGISGRAKIRPAFREWLADAVAGRAQVLLSWRFDRVSRGGLPALSQLLDVLNSTGARFMTYSDRMDSASAAFRITAAVISEIAYAEGESIRTRVSSRHAADRRNGYWTMRRPYGYLVESGRLVQEATEAKVVRAMVERVEAGTSLRSLASWLDAEGIPTPQGRATWGATSVRSILANPVLAGYYPHKGRPARDDAGAVVMVSDDPILSPGEFARLADAMAARSVPGPDGRRRTAVGRAPMHALSGLLKCSCGAALSFNSPKGRAKVGHFRCRRNGGNREACPGVRVNADEAEARVAGAVVAWVAALEPGSPAFEAVATRWLREEDPVDAAERTAAESAVADAEAVVADLEAARYVRREFPGADGAARWQRLYDHALAGLTATRATLSAFPAVTDVGGLLDPETFADSLDPDRSEVADRRALYRLVLDRVTVRRTDGGGHDFVPRWAGE